MQEALKQANQQLGSADAAAQKYGMPPLNTCPDHDTASSPAPGPATPAPAQAWQPRHASPAAVQQVNAAVLNGQIWVAGGLTASTKATASTQTYDPAKNTWSPGPSLPHPVDHAMLVTYRGRLALIGGFLGHGGDPVASDQVLFFDDSAGHWVKGPSLHHARAAGAAAVVGDKIVVVGGRTGTPQKLVPETEVFDGQVWRDGAAIPVPGDHLAAASDRDFLYAVGGREFVPGKNTNAVQRYEPATDRWTRPTTLPEPLSGAGVTIIGGQLFVVSGETTKPAVSAAVRSYDLTDPGATWKKWPSLAQGRHGLAVAAIGTTLYAIDGSVRPGHTASTSTVDALKVPERRTDPAVAWKPRHVASAAVQQMNAAVLNGRIWVAGGLTASTKATASTQSYDPAQDAWVPGPSLPHPVDHAMLVTYRGRLALIGGFLGHGGDPVASDQVLFFDDSIGHWVKGPSLHHARAAGAAAVVGDKIIVVGGRTGTPQKLVAETEVFDGKVWRDGAAIPVPGDHLAATSDRAYLYAVGGRQFVPRTNTNAVQRYEPDTDRWIRLTTLPEPLSGAGVTILAGQLLVVSGETTQPAVSATVRAYDLTDPRAAWKKLPSLAQGRHGLAVAAIGTTVYAVGGSARPGHTASVPTVDALSFS
ncbi:hypothetical protein OWR29_46295 [Actinoplanes sp. Pm04-4]|uniref:Kelch repeat-containing protein n=1 Tax=Paractinoplanes pyxinae TaxID=2997416 RepID=A0ABT4BFY5_9ACTN|nr:kelch repeat-containing protein [Actinoplanes pyxinae]MCY1145460.1 hypothetical protein [Actinoplanes pyxinae]